MLSKNLKEILEVTFSHMELIDVIDCFEISEEDLREFLDQYITRLYENTLS